MFNKWLCIVSVTALMMVSGCAEVRPTKIIVDLKNDVGDSLGTAQLEERADGLMVTVDLKGLEPGAHGFHFHETGKCEGPDFLSAGDHFNPEDKSHGLLNPEGAHAGDLPNLIVEGDGTVQAEVMASGVTFKEGKNTLYQKEGTALIIHEKADDGMNDPAGNAGKRVACGVISLEDQQKKDVTKEKLDEPEKEEEK
ncbi:superoxide dismutase family protein [Bacillus salitolerans]|uniref:Superoxide dismutase [Cu-Zn] n=1 Tax=Bacillus salitolerans TaxID=1437434 RepID=A0ABW4LMX9_9BACI